MAHPFFSEEFVEQERYNIPSIYIPNAKSCVWEIDGRVVGFVALLGNEVGALFVDPRFQRAGIRRALMDDARALRGELDVEVFKANALGGSFYAKYGFELMHEKIHAKTDFEVMRLRLPPDAPPQPSDSATG